jgi:hypothetical protein
LTTPDSEARIDSEPGVDTFYTVILDLNLPAAQNRSAPERTVPEIATATPST